MFKSLSHMTNINRRLSACLFILIYVSRFGVTTANAKEMTANSYPRSIHVSGTGKTLVPPDKADLSLSIETQSKSAETARNQAATAMSALLKSLKSAGIVEKDIQTRTVSLYPNYTPDSANKIIGYQLSNQIAVIVRNLDKLGDIMDAAVNAGGNLARIQGVTFGITNPDKALAAAREEAYRDAKNKAEQYAKLAGISLGAPIQISEGSHIPPMPMPYGEIRAMKAAMSESVSTPVQTGEQEVTVTVDVLFSIE